MGSKYTKAQAKATSEYMKDKHTFRVVVTKEKADQIREHAESMGESVNGFINRAINETMERDNSRHTMIADNQKIVGECAKYIDDELKKKYFFGEEKWE